MIREIEEEGQTLIENQNKLVAKPLKQGQSSIQVPFYIKFIMVLSVYSIQGMATDFFVYSVQTELVIFGANNKQLALLSLISFPWCMKILWAPLQDAYYFKFLGRRKSWIIISSFLLAFLWFYFSFRADNLFKNLSVGELTIIGTATTFLLAVQDISMDGWIVKLAANDAQLARFSFCSSFGWTVGGLVSFQIYMWLQSDEWCQYLFGRNHLLTTDMLVNFIALSFIAMALVVLLVPEQKDSVELEDEEEEEGQGDRLGEIFTKLKLLKAKPDLKTLIFVVFFCELGFQYFDSVGPVVMLDMGMDPNIYAFIGFISIVLEGIVGIIVSSYPEKEMTIFMLSLILRTMNSLFFFLIMMAHDLGFASFQQTLILFGIQNNIAQIGYAMVSIPLLNFFLRICEEKVEGTYIALLTSAFFAAAIWSSTVAFLLVDYLGHNMTMITSLCFDTIFIMFFGKRILKWEQLPVEQWALKED